MGEEPEDGSYIKRALFRIHKAEQKEFIFARGVLLVEGDTEVGALPIIGKKLGFDFDEAGLSVVPVDSNFFAGYLKILEDFRIPAAVICDLDVLITISESIESNGNKIRTSSWIKQLDYLNCLTDDDKKRIAAFQDRIVPIANTGTPAYKLTHLLEGLHAHGVDINQFTSVTDSIRNYKGYQAKEAYDLHLLKELEGFLRTKLMDKGYKIYILNPDFEGIFSQNGLNSLLRNAREKYGKNKVLMGRYVAENIDTDKIPKEFRAIVDDFKGIM